MSLQAKTVLNLLAGAIAGLLAWALTDLTGWFPFLGTDTPISSADPRLLLYGALFGLVLGLLLGIVEALSLDSQRQMWEALLWGGGVGFFGGALGAFAGQSMFAAIAPPSLADEFTPANFFRILIARSIGYALVGVVIGAAQGLARRSAVLVRQGALGGLIGGALGGAIFQIIAAIMNELPHIALVSRLAALVATGALVGFFIGLVQNLFKQAWVRVVLGRNEGKEYLLAKPITTIGRSELSDIGLYGDAQVAPTHAVIEALPAQRRHRLRHVAGQDRAGQYAPTLVNGQPVTAEQWLADGDTVQIARRTLLFQEKASRGVPPLPVAAPPTHAAEPVPLTMGVTAPPRYLGQELTTPPSSPPALPNLSAPSTGDQAAQTLVLARGGGVGSRLVCTTGPYAGQSFPLTHAAATVGRSTEVDISLAADTLISRRQADVTYADGRHVICDLGSANGTSVNGQRLTNAHTLSPGDLIQMGESTLRYE